jgi:multidrug transporter EmrE-like cation transporter
MFLRNKLNDPKVTLLTGMAALLAANVVNIALRWADSASEAWLYGAMGVLYGISFALLLLSARQKARRRAGTEDSSCAR